MAYSDLIDTARAEPRPFTSTEVRRLASDTALEAAVARGDLVRVLPALYAAGEHSESWRVRALASCAWMPAGSALTGRGALYAQGLVAEHRDDLSLVVPRDRHRSGPPWMHVVSQTHPIERVENEWGITLAAPELALIHAFRWTPASDRAALVYEACAGSGIDPGAARALMEVLPRVRLRRDLERLLDNAAAGIESFLEERADRKVLTGVAFAGLVRQHRLRVRGQTFRADAYCPRTRTCVEFDGDAWHARPDQRVRDLRRDALLASVGILTLRFSYRDVMQRPQWCRRRARETLDSRAACLLRARGG